MTDKVKLTGIAELDSILSTSTDEMVESMIIDKALFDSIILPLLIDDTTVALDKDTRFEHLKNIWINYYKTWKDKTTAIINKSDIPDDKKKITAIVSANGVFHPMKIVDEKGDVVDITPALLKPFTVENATEISIGVKANQGSPMVSRSMLGSMNGYIVGDGEESEWSIFIARYTKTNGNEYSEDEEVSKYSLGED